MPQFPIQTETPHSAEFILTEANGYRSRENAFLAHPVTVRVGQPLKAGAAPTTDKPQTFTLAVTAADCDAIAIYAGTSQNPTDGLRIAVIARDAEVNGKLVSWGTIDGFAGATQLALRGIVVRN